MSDGWGRFNDQFREDEDERNERLARRRRQAALGGDRVIIVAEIIERSMFAPHEFPLSPELHAKYLATARDVVDALSSLVA